MSALHQVTDWPVEHVAAAIVVGGQGSRFEVDTIGDTERVYRLASLTKPIVAWATMVAVEDSTVDLDAPLQHVDAPAGATMRHLLAHAAGFGFDGERAKFPQATGPARVVEPVLLRASVSRSDGVRGRWVRARRRRAEGGASTGAAKEAHGFSRGTIRVNRVPKAEAVGF